MTTEQTNLTPAIPAIAKIEQAGGPKWDDRICLRQGIVKTTCEISKASCPFVRNTQACEVAVIAYAGEVKAWMNRMEAGHNLTLWPDDESNSWAYECWFDGEPGPCGGCVSQITASLALILAVAERVGDLTANAIERLAEAEEMTNHDNF